MATITITGVDTRFDGAHQVDFNAKPFNGWELHIIKKLAGVLPAQLDDAMAGMDYDVWVALAVIALIRNGRLDRQRYRDAADALLEAEVGKIQFQPDEEPNPTPPVGANDSDGSLAPSGSASNGTSDRPVSIPTSTGLPG
jgi:hypothetical protein